MDLDFQVQTPLGLHSQDSLAFKRSSEPPSFLQAALLEEWFLSSKKDSVEKLGVLAQTTMDQICLMADLIGIACKCQG